MKFQILTKGGLRFAYDNTNLSWQHGMVEGSRDELDKSVVEVLDSTDPEVVVVHSQVVAVGLVDEHSQLVLPPDRMTEQCPQCGYKEYI